MRKILLASVIVGFGLAASFACAGNKSDVKDNRSSKNIDVEVVNALKEGIHPDVIVEHGLAIKDVDPQNLVKALYSAGVNEQDVYKAAKNAKIPEKTVTAGYNKSVQERNDRFSDSRKSNNQFSDNRKSNDRYSDNRKSNDRFSDNRKSNDRFSDNRKSNNRFADSRKSNDRYSDSRKSNNRFADGHRNFPGNHGGGYGYGPHDPPPDRPNCSPSGFAHHWQKKSRYGHWQENSGYAHWPKEAEYAYSNKR